MPTHKEKIRVLSALLESAHCDAIGSMEDELECGGLCHIIGTTWDCKKSSIGLCVYDTAEDKVHDFCVFCGQPEERK